MWKLQCYFCKDTVSTGRLNRQYYKMHLETMHNIQQHCDGLLDWTLSQQNVEDSEGLNDSSVVSNSLKEIKIQESWSLSSTVKATVPEALLNMQGITIHCVDEPRKAGPQHVKARADITQHLSAANKTREEQLIENWANGCEHGCKICKKLGKYFKSFTKQGLLKHLRVEHEMTERDYKEMFKSVTLITRTNRTPCRECGERIKRTPSSLNMHLKKHGLNIRSYWSKHNKPNTPHSTFAFKAETVKNGIPKTCKGEIGRHTWNSGGSGVGHRGVDMKEVQNKVDGTDLRDGEMEEICPTDILELVIGDGVTEAREEEMHFGNLDAEEGNGEITLVDDKHTIYLPEILHARETNDAVDTPVDDKSSESQIDIVEETAN